VLVVFADARQIRTQAMRCRSAAFGLQGIRKRFVRGEVHGCLGKNIAGMAKGAHDTPTKLQMQTLFEKNFSGGLGSMRLRRFAGASPARILPLQP